jgi:catalase
LVDALNGLFGKHAGERAAHTKGICLTGRFTPSAEAPKLSKAAHFAKEVPIRARFSLGGGDPNAPDNAQDNVRGLAVSFDLGNGANTDLVTISAPVFFANTPELFVEFLKTVASGDKDKLNAFFAAHPESTKTRGSCHIRCRRATPGSTISACTPSPSPMRPARRRSSNIT